MTIPDIGDMVALKVPTTLEAVNLTDDGSWNYVWDDVQSNIPRLMFKKGTTGLVMATEQEDVIEDDDFIVIMIDNTMFEANVLDVYVVGRK